MLKAVKKRRSKHKEKSGGHSRKGRASHTLTQGQIRKLQDWATSFRRTDPRFQILHFFNNVANQDANDSAALEKEGVKSFSYSSMSNFDHDVQDPNSASCFSVWRPTSREALRYMMLGDAVGKGLDIKGKSAKTGRLSAFVPFLQIHNNDHIPKITIHKAGAPKATQIRVFFSTSKRQQYVKEVMEQVQSDLGGTEGNEIQTIDNYAPSYYGLSIPERVLWEGFVIRSPTGISRDPGTAGEHYGTGRPSVPQFQDMNLDALRKPHLPQTPRLVLWQFDDEEADVDDPCNPLTLLMAYEEQQFLRVLPVVSDLDCFLIGTRGVNYEKPLPKDQQKVLQWSVDRIEGILDRQQQQPTATSWTSRWLDVLKVSASKYGFHPKIPALGFSDPKTKLIMKHAIARLSESGAVRHGAECFNFYFPQDLDNEFLVISDYLPGQELSWTYVDTYGLIGILSEKLDNGYTFPLNPKWVLCDDPSWKILWDKLLSSREANERGALAAWYPQQIRDQIENICERHPNGFIPEAPHAAPAAAAPAAAAAATTHDQQQMDESAYDDMDAEMAMELANYELIQYLMDLDKAEKQKEKDRRAGVPSKQKAERAQPGIIYTMEAVPSAAKKMGASSKPVSRPGAFSSYDDVAASKSSWRQEATPVTPPAPVGRPRASAAITKPRENPLSDPVVSNIHSLIEGVKSMPDVVVDVLSTGMDDNTANELMQLYCLEQFCELLLTSDRTNAKALIVAQGVDVDTILVMKTFSYSLAMQEQGSQLLWLLSDDTGGGNCINATSRIVAVSRVVDAMKWFVTELGGDMEEANKGVKFVRSAVGTLSNLVMDKKASKIFKSLESGQSTVTEIMGLYAENADIQVDAVSVLSSSSSLPQDGAIAQRMMEAVVFALGQHYETCKNEGRTVASGCCRALAKWTDDEDHIPLLQQQQNVVEFVKYVMEHAVESKCRKKSITLLERLTGEDLAKSSSKRSSRKNSKQDSRSSNEHMPLEEAMSYLERQEHMSEDAVFLCLSSLNHHLEESSTSSSEKILRKNGIVTICSSMKAFGNAVGVQERGCFLLSAMSRLHPKRVLSSGIACDTLLFSVQCHKNVNALQRSALSAILDLSVDFDCWFQVQQSGKMDFLQELIYNTEDEEAADLGIQILSNFSKFGM